MSTTEIGRLAEQAAADYLEQRGFDIVARNWRNRWCEIDIVAKRGAEAHVVEVKYRHNSGFGGGLGAINQDKLGRLTRAAQIWASGVRFDGPLHISVVSISGQPGNFTCEFYESVTL